ncbi:PEP/pyruvate-binding domain-containing protein [Arthrobacter sp. JSM 101049]|uniref:PEP/pyruvate-binding domain-containing protein n=1 Tax=Arthrobacter sp. JSM 101049 TaxID=929097 RepID=UPI00356955B6
MPGPSAPLSPREHAPAATTHRPVDVAPLGDFGAADVGVAGGKAANLGELLRAGLPVPPGFVVTTHAYAATAERAGLERLVSDPGNPPDPARLRSAIRSVEVPTGVRAGIAAAYRELGEDVPVAVRSSATAEDLPGAAFAGQQDTYLNVVGVEAVVDAVHRCWASLWTDRAVAYRRERAIDPAQVRIAVVVQVMVDSEIAGVMFTADPVSGTRERIVVDAGAGLGEAVVSGLVTPDHYVLDWRGRLLDWNPGRGEVVIRATPGGGVQQVAGSAGKPGFDDALLTRGELAELAAQARSIHAHFGRPQDIEWALADGRPRIVQARPMTALPPESVPLGPIQRLQGSILTEYLPVRPYPMDVTTQIARGPAKMMRDIATFYGIDGAFEDYLREEDGVVVQLVPPAPHPTLRALSTPAKLAYRARRFKASSWTRDPRQVAFLADIDALESLELAELPWEQLLTVPERSLAVQDYCRDLRIDYLPGSALALLRMLLLCGLLGRRGLIADLLGGARTRTEDSNRSLAMLAEQVRSDPRLHALVTGRDAAAALAALSRDEGFAGFRAGMAAFLHEFGRRETTSPLLVSPPTLAESPAVVLGMVQSLATHTAPGAEPSSRSATALGELLDHPLLRGRRRREGIRRWVRAAQEGVAFREDTHFHFTAALPTLRRALLEIGRRLHHAGLLEEIEDVFHLRWEEVQDLADPRAIPADQGAQLTARIGQRKTKRAELSGQPIIDPLRVFPPAEAGDAIATGTPASSGTATGAARIIRGVEDFDRLRDGDVLVCPYTNPAWTPLFQRAAAVVVDTGAAASHAAIVAREYGIPAVMGTGTGTSAITDGEAITVDGGRGIVTSAPRGH